MSPPALRARQDGHTASFDDGMWHPPAAETPPWPVDIPPEGNQPAMSSMPAIDWWTYQAEGAAVPFSATQVAPQMSAPVSLSTVLPPPPTSVAEQHISGQSALAAMITDHPSSLTAVGTQTSERLGVTESPAFELPLEPSPIPSTKPGFKITYLTPLFVIAGVMLGVMVATWVWGRWVRRRGRTNSVTGSTHSDDFQADDNSTAYLYGGLSTSTNARYAGGARRVSARRNESYEDFKLPDKENYQPMPPPGTKPRYGTDSEDDCTSEHPKAHRERTVRGWVKTMRSPRTFTGSTMNRSPRSAEREVEVFKGCDTSIAPSDSPSGRRHGVVYPTSPRSAAIPTCDAASGSQRLQTPMSYIDEDSFYSQDTARIPLVRSVSPPAGSRYVPSRDRPASKHSRFGSVASDMSDGFQGVRRSVLEHTQMLKDEDSIDDYTMESTDEDEWSATSPTSPHSPPRNTLHTIMESTPASPALGGALASMRLSAAIAQDRRHSSAVSRRSRRSTPTSSAIATSNSANNLLMRLKDRLEKRSAARSQQFTVTSPTPSEAQIGSAFRTPGSPRPPPPPPKDVPRIRLPVVDGLKRIPVLNASAISLELRTPPPRSQLVVDSSRRGQNASSVSNSSATPSEIRRGQVRAQTRHVRVSSIGGSQDAPSIRLERSHSRSASLSSASSKHSSTSGGEPSPLAPLAASRLTPTSSSHSRPSGLPMSKLRKTPSSSPSPSPSRLARQARSDSIESDGSHYPSRARSARDRVTDTDMTSRALKRVPAKQVSNTNPSSDVNTWTIRGGVARVEREDRELLDSAPRQRRAERSHDLEKSANKRPSLIPGSSSLVPSPTPRVRQLATGASSRVARPRPSRDNAVAPLTTQKHAVRRAPSPNRVDEMLADSWASNKI